MSEYEDYYEDAEALNDVDENLSDEDILEIQQEYRKKRLIESLIGPMISTVFHIVLIIILAVMITDKYKKEIPEIVIKMEEVEEVKIEEPPPIEEPEPIEEPTEDVVNPVLTTVEVENVDTNDAALEDVNDEAPSTDDDSTVEAVSDVVVSPSAFASPNVFGGRSAAGRASAVSKFGGSAVGQQALQKALWWLAKVQNPDGSWGNSNERYKTGVTGLALLTFLAHGETHLSKSFGLNVKKAMNWLCNSEEASDPYAHGIKTCALAEAYAMTGMSMLHDVVEICIKKVLEGQQDGGSYYYKYNRNEKEGQDLSIGGWNYQAMKAAYGAGIGGSELMAGIEKGVGWLKKFAAKSDSGNGFPYNPIKSDKVKHTMRAVGVLCLQLFGEGDCPEVQDEMNKIMTHDLLKLNWQDPPKSSLYGWYYATQAMFHKGGQHWKSWNAKFQKMLVANQNKEGYWEYPSSVVGSFKNGTTQGRVYATTFCSLMLTVYYRYLPSNKGALGSGSDEKKAAKILEEERLDLIE